MRGCWKMKKKKIYLPLDLHRPLSCLNRSRFGMCLEAASPFSGLKIMRFLLSVGAGLSHIKFPPWCESSDNLVLANSCPHIINWFCGRLMFLSLIRDQQCFLGKNAPIGSFEGSLYSLQFFCWYCCDYFTCFCNIRKKTEKDFLLLKNIFTQMCWRIHVSYHL